MCTRCRNHERDVYDAMIDAHGPEKIVDVTNSRRNWNRRSWPIQPTNVIRDMFEFAEDFAEEGESEEVEGYASGAAARWPDPFVGYDVDMDGWPEWFKPILEREETNA